MRLEILPRTRDGPTGACGHVWSFVDADAQRPTSSAYKRIDVAARLPQDLRSRSVIVRPVIASILELIRKETPRLVAGSGVDQADHLVTDDVSGVRTRSNDISVSAYRYIARLRRDDQVVSVWVSVGRVGKIDLAEFKCSGPR